MRPAWQQGRPKAGREIQLAHNVVAQRLQIELRAVSRKQASGMAKWPPGAMRSAATARSTERVGDRADRDDGLGGFQDMIV